MNFRHRCCILFLVILQAIVSGDARAQLTAAFSVNKAEGCKPLVVQFRDESTGNPTSWRWDLGNGTISFLQNPAATYFNPGTYNVKLVVRNAAGADSLLKTAYITVYNTPVVAFSVSDTAGCFPLKVRFTDLSQPGDGTITNWLWDFGDGNSDTLPNTEHTYSTSGSFNVSLQVRNSKGCIQAITKLNHIRLTNGVRAGFTIGSVTNCRPPTPVPFINTSTGTGVLSYQWNFGDGNTSTLANPTHTYTAPGTYTVTLIARNNTGCTDTLVRTQSVTIGTVNAGFTSPAQVCAGANFTLQNTSVPAPSGARWSFGDGSNSSLLNPVKQYALPGTYSIKLVSLFGACSDSVTRTIQVLPKPVAAFTATPLGACAPPLAVNFTNNSSTAVSYKWYFGDGDSSSAAQPSHTYTSYGTYTVTLVATNAAGCSETLVQSSLIQIQKPQVALLDLPQEGCIPYVFQPAYRILTKDTIASLEWRFGDGSVSSVPNPAHTYTQPGTYTVTLVYTTTGGCTDSVVVPNAVRVGQKPLVAFTATPRISCAFQPVQFNDLSTGAVADQWLWRFGDGGTSTQKNPIHQYRDTGWFSVSLVVWSNGCKDTLAIRDYVYIKPPIARFIDSSGCSARFTRWFRDQSIGASSWFWDFGDGSQSTTQNPVHTYAAAGDYWVTLTVKNDTCEHTTIRQIRVIAENIGFQASDTVLCKGRLVSFSTPGVAANRIASYDWTFGDGSSGSGPSPGHTYLTQGLYTVRLVITDINGCRDTLTKNQYIRVNGPTADFSAQVAAVCTQATVPFADASFSDGTHPIKEWIWNYGDGSSDTLTAPPFQHTYTQPGVYTISLTVKDSIGCSHTIQKNNLVIISKPSVGFRSPDTLSCAGQPIRFINESQGNGPFQYQWDFGNNSSSTQAQPSISYAAEGDYTIRLRLTDRYGCKDSLEKTAYIRIRNPRALFDLSDSVATCPPLVVNFTNQSVNMVQFEWDFGDNTRSSVQNPVHFYTYPGIYRAKLRITGPGGCTDSMIRVITVRGPQGSFRYDQFSGCEPKTIQFTGITKDTVQFIWDFNDGTVITTNDSIISHTYTRRGVFLPRMILKDPQGCQVSIPGVDSIRIYGVDARFGLSQQILCDSGLVNFRDSSISNDIITGYNWDLGDGTLTTQQNPSRFYNRPGNYTIKLQVTTQRGCRDSLTLPLPLKLVLRPLTGIRGDTSSCVPALAQFSTFLRRADSSSLQWRWDFGNGQVSTLEQPAPVTYPLAATYPIRLITTNSSGCKDTAQWSFTAHPLPPVDASADAILCRNSSINLQATGALTYLWSPAQALSCTQCAAPVANPVQDTRYQVMGKNIFGCSSTDSVLIRVQQPFQLQVGRGDTLCVGESLQLFVNGTDNYRWTPALGLDNDRSNRPKATPTQTTLYQVVGTDKNGCFSDTGYVPVQVYPYPTVEAGPDLTIPSGGQIQLNPQYSADVSGVRWLPSSGLSCANCPSPMASPRITTTYTVQASNAGGCQIQDVLTVFVFCDNGNLFVPNTFSPNGDGSNDVFYPRGKGLFSVKNLRIFNRWGEVVFDQNNFDANDPSKGWDGTVKGKKAPLDVYVYTIDIICENQTVLRFNGNVALIR